jgi:hypothetical protein
MFSRLLIASAFLIWGYFYYLTNHYDGTRPTVVQEEYGRVYSLNSHGHIVYLTTAEKYRLRLLVVAAIGCFVSGFLIDRKVRASAHSEHQCQNDTADEDC